MDETDVKVAAAATAAVAVVGAGWFGYSVFLAPAGGGANIGLGLFFLLVVPAATIWSVVTAVSAFRLPDVGARWRALSIVALLVLAFMTIFLDCWACLVGEGEPLIAKLD